MSNIQTIPVADLELLKQVDTPTVCNVIELFDLRPRNTGYMDHRIKASFPELPPVVGYATTATFRSATQPREGDKYLGVTEQLKAMESIPEPRIVVFQDLDDPPAAATFGEVMCTAYRTHGCVALITSGAGRDLEQVRALEFSVFTSGAICSHGYCHLPSVHLSVRVGGITVYPGDLLHGDANGVTTIPNAIASRVARLCGEFMEAEGEVMSFLRTGSRDVEGYANVVAEFQKKIAELRQRAKASVG